VLDGDQLPLPQWGTARPAIFGQCLLWPNGWMDQDAAWYGGSPCARPHWARWDPAPFPQKGYCPQFSAHVYCGQTAGRIKMSLGMEVGLGPDHIVLDEAQLPQERGTTSPNFRPMSVVDKRLDESRCDLVRKLSLAQATLCSMRTSSPPVLKGTQSPIFSPCPLWPNGRPSHLLLSTCCIFLSPFPAFLDYNVGLC